MPLPTNTFPPVAAPIPIAAPPASAIRPHLDAFAIGIMIAMCVCLAVGQVAIKIANAGISPVFQAGLRSLAGAVLLAAFAKARGVRLFARDGIFWPALLTSLFFTAEFGFLYPGLALTTAGHAVVLLYMSPFVVAVGAHFLIPGDRLTVMKLAGLILALTGVAIIVFGREAAPTGVQSPTLAGDLLCLAGAFAWGGLTLTIRATRLASVAPERISFIQLAVSGVLLCGLSKLLGEAGLTDPTPLAWGAFAFTVVFVAGFVFTTTTWLFTRYPASRVMAFMLLTPGFGVVAAHLLLGEAVGYSLLAGLALVLAGLWFVNRPARSQ
jgi:drug/metabolite transporter (DMT)-like permease